VGQERYGEGDSEKKEILRRGLKRGGRGTRHRRLQKGIRFARKKGGGPMEPLREGGSSDGKGKESGRGVPLPTG